MRTDESNLRAIKSALRHKIQLSRMYLKIDEIQSIEELKLVGEEFSSNSNGFIVETVKYTPKSIRMNITSLYGDYGLYNFTITVPVSIINKNYK